MKKLPKKVTLKVQEYEELPQKTLEQLLDSYLSGTYQNEHYGFCYQVTPMGKGAKIEMFNIKWAKNF